MFKTYNIVEKSILNIQKDLSENKITSRSLVLRYLDRIAAYDQNGQKLNSIIELNPDALHIAEALDYERQANGLRSSLHGIPVLLKDNIITGDKMHTSAGSYALRDFYGDDDSFLVKKLRKAGAIILGKTNMTEWANYMSDSMPSGYSSRGGHVLSPYGKGLNVGGSSSGSAIAVSANFCTVAIGTQTSGSVINPSCENGIVGLKPTIGLISRTGIIPVSHLQDTAGPMGRTVEDAAILLGAMIGYDTKDPITITSNYNGYSDYTPFLSTKGLEDIRLGIPREFFYDNLSNEESSIMDSMINIMKQQGAIIIDNITLPNAIELQSKHYILYEFKSEINAFLKKHCSNLPVSSLTELMAYHEAHADIMLKYGQSFLITTNKTSGTLTEPEYLKHRMKELEQSRESVDQTISEYNLDALVFPSDKGAKLIDKAGYPSITVPAGLLKDGQPFGITFSAGAFSEPKLLGMSYSLEQATNKRTPPNI